MAFLDTYGELVSHVHLKDVDGAVMDEIRTSGLGLEEAWRRGVFCLFGEGSVDLAGDRRAAAERWATTTGWWSSRTVTCKPGQTIASLREDARHNREVLRELGL